MENEHPEDWIICGHAAIAELVAQRPKALRKLWLTEDMQGPAGEWCQLLAAEKRSYSTQPWERLTKLVKHPRHEGLVAFIDPPLQPKFQISHLADWQKSGEPLLVIDRMMDADQLGRLLRVGASFGLRRALWAEHPGQATLDGAIYSASGGALEHIRCYRIGKLGPLFKPLAAHFVSVGIGGPGASKPQWGKPVRAPGRSVALFVSDHEGGLDPKLVPQFEHRVYVPTTGALPLPPAETVATLLAWLGGEAKKPGTGFRARQAAKKKGS